MSTASTPSRFTGYNKTNLGWTPRFNNFSSRFGAYRGSGRYRFGHSSYPNGQLGWRRHFQGWRPRFNGWGQQLNRFGQQCANRFGFGQPRFGQSFYGQPLYGQSQFAQQPAFGWGAYPNNGATPFNAGPSAYQALGYNAYSQPWAQQATNWLGNTTNWLGNTFGNTMGNAWSGLSNGFNNLANNWSPNNWLGGNGQWGNGQWGQQTQQALGWSASRYQAPVSYFGNSMGSNFGGYQPSATPRFAGGCGGYGLNNVGFANSGFGRSFNTGFSGFGSGLGGFGGGFRSSFGGFGRGRFC
jgi:hypothetical protein